jgi:hypothetical protein
MYNLGEPLRRLDGAMYIQNSFVSSSMRCERRTGLLYTYPANTSVPSGLLYVVQNRNVRYSSRGPDQRGGRVPTSNVTARSSTALGHAQLRQRDWALLYVTVILQEARVPMESLRCILHGLRVYGTKMMGRIFGDGLLEKNTL